MPHRPDGPPIDFQAGRFEGNLLLVRLAGSNVQKVFAQEARSVALGGREFLQSPVAVDLSAALDATGRIARVRLSAAEPVALMLQGRPVKLGPGTFAARDDLQFAADPAGSLPASNSPENQQRLAAGLAPLLKRIMAERDELTERGLKNLALGAKVTASALRDPRFPPELVIDNKTWEYPTAGRLDYTQDPLLTTPSGGYGREALPLTGTDESPMTSWPFYVPPTYWLLPYQQTGWIRLELAQPSPVRLVRLLNTSNAGANDYATMKYRVELLSADGKVAAERKGEFGRALDRPFRAAFRIPEAFSEYGQTFRGMLEPGVKVPFGDGWQTIPFPEAPTAKFVKVYIDSYWALGGGLNEIQVY
jgi:hypothetical protein